LIVQIKVNEDVSTGTHILLLFIQRCLRFRLQVSNKVMLHLDQYVYNNWGRFIPTEYKYLPIPLLRYFACHVDSNVHLSQI